MREDAPLLERASEPLDLLDDERLSEPLSAPLPRDRREDSPLSERASEPLDLRDYERLSEPLSPPLPRALREEERPLREPFELEASAEATAA